MKDRDCESCKKFSRVDPYESEGYCDAKRTWVDPGEGEDCKMHEFTLHSANKYKDGTPIMSEPERVYCETDCVLIHGDTDTYETRKATKNSMYGKTAQSNQLDTSYPYLPPSASISTMIERINDGITENVLLKQRVDELSEEYDAVLKTHGDTLEEHLDRICALEHLYENILDDLCAMRERLCKITVLLVGQDEFSHIFSNFCGNCIHAEMEDGLCTCALSGEALDPDYASCLQFEPSFTHVGDRPDWMEKIRKDMSTPSEPTEGCKDCKCAVDGMCVKYNCSLGAICATQDCYESPF